MKMVYIGNINVMAASFFKKFVKTDAKNSTLCIYWHIMADKKSIMPEFLTFLMF